MRRPFAYVRPPPSPPARLGHPRHHRQAGTPPAVGEVFTLLRARVRPGDSLRLSAPCGDLVLPEGHGPLLLASAGIGCTPMLSMLEHLADFGHPSPVAVLHADAEPGDHPDRMDLTALPVAPGTSAYLCGPLPFMRAVREQFLAEGVPTADIHYEVFGPDLWLASA